MWNTMIHIYFVFQLALVTVNKQNFSSNRDPNSYRRFSRECKLHALALNTEILAQLLSA